MMPAGIYNYSTRLSAEVMTGWHLAVPPPGPGARRPSGITGFKYENIHTHTRKRRPPATFQHGLLDSRQITSETGVFVRKLAKPLLAENQNYQFQFVKCFLLSQSVKYYSCRPTKCECIPIQYCFHVHFQYRLGKKKNIFYTTFPHAFLYHVSLYGFKYTVKLPM